MSITKKRGTNLISLIIMSVYICICAAPAWAKKNNADKIDVKDSVQKRLRARNMVIQNMETPEDLPEEFLFDVEYKGKLKSLYLEKHSFRGPNFQVLIEDENGDFVEIDPGPVRTYLGFVADEEAGDTLVGAVLTEEGLHAAVHSFTEPSWNIAPLQEDEVEQTLQEISEEDRHEYGFGRFHAVYEKELVEMPMVPHPVIDYDDLEEPVMMEFGQGPSSFNLPGQIAAASMGLTGQLVQVKQAEIGIEVDYKAYANRYGSSTSAVQTNMDKLMAQELILWVRDCQVKHVFGVISIRTNESTDPYKNYSGTSSDLLNKFRNVWNGNDGPRPSSTHDLAAMHTGGGGGGLAWVGQVCTSYKYALAGANTADGWRGYIKHELGHTWSLGHGPGRQELNRDGVQFGIMWTGPHDRFTTDESQYVINHRDSRSCLYAIPADQHTSHVPAVGPYGAWDRYWNVWTSNGSQYFDVCANDRDSNNNSFDITSVGFIGGQTPIGTLAISANSGPSGRDQVKYTPPATIGPTTIVKAYYNIKDTTGKTGWGRVDFEVKQGAATYQAEDRTAQSGTSISTVHGGYYGSGFVDYGSNCWIEWNNVASRGETQDLDFRYANGSTGNRTCDIYVNGSKKGTLSFAPTGNWSTWHTQSITVSLNSGNNTVRVQAPGAGPNLDQMYVH